MTTGGDHLFVSIVQYDFAEQHSKYLDGGNLLSMAFLLMNSECGERARQR